MTIMPARRLECAVSSMMRKGRLHPGADADVVVFDPETVTDRATYMNPAQTCEGIVHVLVAGRLVVRDGELRRGIP